MRIVAAALLAGALLTGCLFDRGPSDEELAARVEAALEGASDLEGAQIDVAVSDGVVTLSGSLVCETCASARTPAGSGSVEQSVAAIVRAIPGVRDVDFTLDPGGP